jgi:hypothetical protein
MFKISQISFSFSQTEAIRLVAYIFQILFMIRYFSRSPKSRVTYLSSVPETEKRKYVRAYVVTIRVWTAAHFKNEATNVCPFFQGPERPPSMLQFCDYQGLPPEW